MYTELYLYKAVKTRNSPCMNDICVGICIILRNRCLGSMCTYAALVKRESTLRNLYPFEINAIKSAAYYT